MLSGNVAYRSEAYAALLNVKISSQTLSSVSTFFDLIGTPHPGFDPMTPHAERRLFEQFGH